MKKFLMIAALIIAAVFSTGCTRITDGEVGVRITPNGTIKGTELDTGYHQVLWGDVLQFPIRQLAVKVADQKPMTSDNSPLADFDATVVYNINPAAVADLYKERSKSFHVKSEGDILLMYSYMQTLIQNAIVKSVRQYKSLEVNDNRAKIEDEIQQILQEQLKAEKLENSIIVTAVQVTGILPNSEIQKAATDLVKSQNDLKIKENEIKIAKAEAERQAILSSNATQNIAYMNAQANLLIAQGVKEGKVGTIIIPSSLTALGHIGK